jgi:hypothetical protein
MKSALTLILFIVFAIAYWKPEVGQESIDTTISQKIEEALNLEYDSDPAIIEGDNYIEVLSGAESRALTEEQIRHFLEKLDKKKRAGVRFWWLGDKKIVAASAFGTDSKHHFVNAYLVGYAPFEEEWILIL